MVGQKTPGSELSVISLSESLCLQRLPFARHEHDYRDRNYLFGVNDRDTVDGTRVGNELRFINHADPPNANVDAQCQ